MVIDAAIACGSQAIARYTIGSYRANRVQSELHDWLIDGRTL
jgi:hypothetical protein